MNEDRDMFYITMTIVVTVLAITVCILMGQYTKRVQSAFEHDYCETVTVGSHSLVWQKCKTNK